MRACGRVFVCLCVLLSVCACVHACMSLVCMRKCVCGGYKCLTMCLYECPMCASVHVC